MEGWSSKDVGGDEVDRGYGLWLESHENPRDASPAVANRWCITHEAAHVIDVYPSPSQQVVPTPDYRVHEVAMFVFSM